MGVELCLFAARGRRAPDGVELAPHADFLWRRTLAEARPGQLYAYRVHGPFAPEQGLRFNAARTLLDPYARAIVGRVAAGHGRCEVIDDAFTWGDDRPPGTPWEETIVYEAHVKGLTYLHPEIPPPLRGTYAAIGSEPIVSHLRKLGVTALELLPVHACADDKRLLQLGLCNYWGYNSVGFFAPDPRFGADNPVAEFKTMVKRLHAAGIEVILDVVYNHTGEGDHHGPTLCFRGIDNATYYRLDPANPWRYVDYTGTGNTLNLPHPAALRLVMDSLRYWVEEMHVDGFRFDLAPALARGPSETDPAFEPRGAFLAAIAQDPVLARVKLIAEPWDVGEGGYRLGAFPAPWAEWNDRYRDVLRRYWRGDESCLAELAARLTGSRELFGRRAPQASVNFVTAHDGFTLEDLVSYAHKHNEANGEHNRDGTSENYSRDWESRELKDRQKRNFLATLLLSRGVPMLLAGDELGHTQRGNNNAYCQDNEISWLNWQGGELGDFIARLAALRKMHCREEDTVWLAPEGREMTDEDWKLPYARCAGMRTGGMLLLLNAHDGEVAFKMPAGGWQLVLDTAGEQGFGTTYALRPRSLALLTPTS